MKLLKIIFIAAITITMCSFAFRATDDGQEQLYKEFLSKFKPYKLSKTIKFEVLGKPLKNRFDIYLEAHKPSSKVKRPQKVLTTKYSAFIPTIDDGMISRMGPSTYEAEALFVSKDYQFNTLIYSKTQSHNTRLKSYYLTTFDKEGKQIAAQYLGFARVGEPMKLISSKSMEFIVKEFERNYENKLVAVETKKFVITTSGQILEQLTETQEEEKMPSEQNVIQTKVG